MIGCTHTKKIQCFSIKGALNAIGAHFVESYQSNFQSFESFQSFQALSVFRRAGDEAGNGHNRLTSINGVSMKLIIISEGFCFWPIEWCMSTELCSNEHF